jgi:hypothetical protein
MTLTISCHFVFMLMRLVPFVVPEDRFPVRGYMGMIFDLQLDLQGIVFDLPGNLWLITIITVLIRNYRFRLSVLAGL